MSTKTAPRVPKHVRRRGDAYGRVVQDDKIILMPAGIYPSSEMFMKALEFFAPLEGATDAVLEEHLTWFKANSEFKAFEHDRSPELDHEYGEISINEICPNS